MNKWQIDDLVGFRAKAKVGNWKLDKSIWFRGKRSTPSAFSQHTKYHYAVPMKERNEPHSNERFSFLCDYEHIPIRPSERQWSLSHECYCWSHSFLSPATLFRSVLSHKRCCSSSYVIFAYISFVPFCSIASRKNYARQRRTKKYNVVMLNWQHSIPLLLFVWVFCCINCTELKPNVYFLWTVWHLMMWKHSLATAVGERWRQICIFGIRKWNQK